MLATTSRALILGAVAILMSGCWTGSPSPRATPEDAFAPAAGVPFSPGFLDGITWLSDGQISFGYLQDAGGLSLPRQLWKIGLDGSGAGPLALDPGTECSRADALAPQVLANGDLSYQLRCAPGAGGPFTYRTALLAVGQTGQSKFLMPLTDLPFIGRQAAWSPDQTSGLLGGGSAICEGIVRIDSSGFRAWDIRLGSGAGGFSLADFLAPTGDCAGSGQADLPAWSSKGQVAFFASTAAVGVSGTARLDAPWALYFVDSALSNPRIVLDGFDDARGLSWSPDGRWLAIIGTVNGAAGAWLLDAVAGRMLRISGEPTWLELAWSPDGSRIAGLLDHTALGAARTASIVVLDVSGVVGKP